MDDASEGPIQIGTVRLPSTSARTTYRLSSAPCCTDSTCTSTRSDGSGIIFNLLLRVSVDKPETLLDLRQARLQRLPVSRQQEADGLRSPMGSISTSSAWHPRTGESQ